MRLLPGCDGRPAPFLGCDVAHGLRQLPPVAGRVLQHTGSLAVLPGCQLLDDSAPWSQARANAASTSATRTLTRCVHPPPLWRDPLATDVGDHDGTVQPDAQLGTVRFTDPHPLLEAKRRLEPRHCCPHIRIDEHRCHGGRRRRTIRQHCETLNPTRAAQRPPLATCARGSRFGPSGARLTASSWSSVSDEQRSPLIGLGESLVDPLREAVRLDLERCDARRESLGRRRPDAVQRVDDREDAQRAVEVPFDERQAIVRPENVNRPAAAKPPHGRAAASIRALASSSG